MKKILLIVLLLSSTAYAQDRIINYQGVLLDNEGQPVADGLYDAFFELYDAQVDGNRLWFDSDLDITTVNGAFSVRLGSNEPISSVIDFTQTLWLEIEVETSPFFERVRLDPEPSSISVLSKLEAKLDSVLNARGTAVPIGTIQAYGGNLNSIPDGWLLCDGEPYSVSEYEKLAEVLGNNWDINSGSMFKVPDLRGMFLRGVNMDRSDEFADPDISGRHTPEPDGEPNMVGTLQEDATSVPDSDFTGDTTTDGGNKTTRSGDGNHNHGYGEDSSPWGSDGSSRTNVTTRSSTSNGSHTHRVNIDHSHNVTINGGGDPETRPINAYVYYIIKAK
jgi:hypothetical protein